MTGRAISRRMFVVGVSVFAAPAARCFERVRAENLWAGGGKPSELGRRLEGQTVVLRGYMAPPLRAEAKFFVLTRIPMAVCPFCDSEASWPEDLVLVETRERIRATRFNDLIEATGRLEFGTKIDLLSGFVSRVRLVEAGFARV